MARQPLPEGQARTDKLYTKVRPAAGSEFRALCNRLGITPADGLRQAAADWVRKHTTGATR